MQAYDNALPGQQLTHSPAQLPAPHMTAMLEKLKKLKEAGKYCDVVLHMGAKTVEAHRNVLAAWSPYFDSVLCGGVIEKEHVTVACENHEDAFLQLVEFMYTGRAAVRDPNVAHLLSLADQFKIEPLKCVCEEFLRGNIHIKNFVTVFGLARRFRLHSLQANITSFVQQNLSEATKQPEFNSLTPNLINAFVAMDPMSALKPEYKVFLIVGWISADFENREKYLSLLFSKVAWAGLSNNFLAEISKSENFFTSNLSCLFMLLRSVNKAGLSLGPYTDGFPHLKEANREYCTRTQVERLPEASNDEPITAIVISKVKYQPTNEDTRSEPLGHEGKESKTMLLDDGRTELPTMNSDSESDSMVDEGRESEVSKITESPSYSRIKGCTAKYPARATRRKGNPVKVIGEYDNSDEEKKSLKKRKRSLLSKPEPDDDVEEQEVVDMKKRRGRPRKKLSFPRQPDEILAKQENNTNGKRSRGRPKKLVKTECREYVESISVEEDGPDGERQLSSVRDRNTWKRCDESGCQFTASIMDDMEEHMLTVHDREQNQHCNICEFKSSYSKIYYTHMKDHFEGPPYCCDYVRCSYKADRIQPLMTHRMIHTDERPYECKVCKTKFRSTIYLQIHQRQHTGEKPFTCEICERSFSTKGTLDQHQISHTSQRPFLCDTCGFATKYQSHLIAHKRIHSGEVFRCRYPNCEYSTPKRSQMKAHTRSHLSIRSHTCSTCGRAFVEKSHLVRHEKIHLTEKPHKCGQCEYSSSRRDKLKEHALKHHSIESPVSLTSTPYKPRRPRRQKEPVPISTTSEDAQLLLEQMVECSAPHKMGVDGSETLNDEELANIQMLQQEQRRALENAQEEQRRQLEQKQEEERRRMLEAERVAALPPKHMEALPATDLPHEMDLAHIQHIFQNSHAHIPPAQHLHELQTPHMSVSIVGGDASHLSHDAVAFVQSVAESAVMDTPAPLMNLVAQTTSLNNLTITTLELR